MLKFFMLLRSMKASLHVSEILNVLICVVSNRLVCQHADSCGLCARVCQGSHASLKVVEST